MLQMVQDWYDQGYNVTINGDRGTIVITDSNGELMACYPFEQEVF
ncbi:MULTISPECIES: hypothetical protein [unclassified Parvimonas]|nr:MULTISPECIES: hypothetical protein [unclassified Parvimonas]MEB3089985.1 hypothetical protein [Parvimonas sp. M20]